MIARPVSAKRLEPAERAYRALVEGDLETAMAGLADEVEWRNPDDAVEAGTRTGRESFSTALERLLELFDYDRFEIVDSAEVGDAVALKVRIVGRGRTSGAPIDDVFGHVWRFENDRAVVFEWFSNTDGALEAVGADRWPSGSGPS